MWANFMHIVKEGFRYIIHLDKDSYILIAGSRESQVFEILHKHLGDIIGIARLRAYIRSIGKDVTDNSITHYVNSLKWRLDRPKCPLRIEPIGKNLGLVGYRMIELPEEKANAA